jgi:hypothetical protein
MGNEAISKHAGDRVMSETKHTPGPWAAYQDHPDNHEILYIREAGSSFLSHEVAVIYSHNLADAALVSAAPELLEALEAAHSIIARFIEDHEGRKPHPSINYNDAKMIDFSMAAAIRKAKGE